MEGALGLIFILASIVVFEEETGLRKAQVAHTQQLHR
jgi:hypothetical protein